YLLIRRIGISTASPPSLQRVRLSNFISPTPHSTPSKQDIMSSTTRPPASSSTTAAPPTAEKSYFEQQRAVLLQEIGVSFEHVLANINKLNRSMEGVIAVGNEFSSVEALWSQFENVMAKDPDAEGETHAGEGEDGSQEDETELPEQGRR
ncbi:DASH complex subunit, partial [Lachnellula occidentalis]